MKYINKSTSLTKYGKLLLFIFILLLMLFGTSFRVFASVSDNTADSDTSSAITYTVTGIDNSEQLSNLAPIEIVRSSSQNTDPLLYYISNNNLLKVTATIEDSNGTISTKTLSVLWSFTNNETTITDTTVCGEYLETGIIKLPDTTYEWGEGVLSTLTLLVKVSDLEEPIEIVELAEAWNEFDTAFSLEQNSSIEELLKKSALQTAWPCYDASGNKYTCTVIYNTEHVKENTVGIYDIIATFEAPLNCRFSDNLTVPSYSLPVTVQAYGHPRLDLFYISPNYEFILFPCITSGIDIDTVEVWLSENNGDWRLLKLNNEVYLHPNMLDLYAWYLTEGSSYRIQMKYEGGQTGIASFTYEWDMLSNKEYLEGDRDGGDTNGNPAKDSDKDSSKDEDADNIPSNSSSDSEDISVKNEVPIAKTTNIVTTAPPSESTAQAVPNTTQIQETPLADYENSSADREIPYLLGSEITLMLANLGTARFSAGPIMLDIPNDAIESLGLGDTDRFLVTILPLKNNGFSIDILNNDIAVTELSSMLISLPYRPAPNTTPVLVSEDGKKIASGNYQKDTGLVTFSIQKTGTFYIKEEAVPIEGSFIDDTILEPTPTVTEISSPDKVNDHSIFKRIALATAGIIIFSAGITLFIYRKKGEHDG